LYALSRQIQWSWPASHGEDQFVVMFGGLHIELAALKALGNLLENSGWTGAPIQAYRPVWDSRLVSEGISRDTHPTCSSDHSL